jgi:hypothetical protein
LFSIVFISGCNEQKSFNYDISFSPNPIEPKVDIVLASYLTGWGKNNQAKTCDWSIGILYNSILGFYDFGDPRIADAHIKMAVECGVNTFIVVTSRPASDWK